MFFHQTASNYDGSRMTEAYLIAKLAMVQREDNRTAQIIADKSSRPVESVNEWLRTERLMDTGQAKSEGLIHDERSLVIPQNAWTQQTLTH